ncbi:hypothetical protein [Tautonia plasticadhaerens]|uniref:LTXXQ motif protein n=1 Tax=Tautonia plasticadhaerens TaxID=2527974 RepID=A0A518GUW8_9BACT|nr:hypothetical protein [Tautonia plasticadhaerens]QDV32382.1 hypothetical protein ElP_02140 [Tautonia plasticadhaerens]
MKSFRSTCATALLAGSALLAGMSGHAQDEPTPSPPITPGTNGSEKTFPPYRRVPSYFGQVGLSDQQKADIYALRGRYRAELSELERQIEEMKRREMEECESVLTDSQRKLLTQLRDAKRPQSSVSGN